jgi:hypothetical protein
LHLYGAPAESRVSMQPMSATVAAVCGLEPPAISTRTSSLPPSV